MSVNQTLFIRWFFGITSALIISGVVGIFSMYSMVVHTSEGVETNKINIEKVSEIHSDDVVLLRGELWDMRADQKIIMADIKEILKEMK